MPFATLPREILVSALDLIADGVAIVDTSGTIRYANRPLAELFGYEDGDLDGQPVEMLVPPESSESHRDQRAKYAEHQTSRQMGRPDLDIEGQHANGTRFPIDVQLKPLPGGPGMPMVTVTVRDMTDVRRASADRAISRLDLAATTDRVTQLIAWHDVVIQRLFALGAHLEAQAGREIGDSAARLSDAAQRIDELIEVVRKQISNRVAA
jgi:PAS domain S-box-containing protein